MKSSSLSPCKDKLYFNTIIYRTNFRVLGIPVFTRTWLRRSFRISTTSTITIKVSTQCRRGKLSPCRRLQAWQVQEVASSTLSGQLLLAQKMERRARHRVQSPTKSWCCQIKQMAQWLLDHSTKLAKRNRVINYPRVIEVKHKLTSTVPQSFCKTIRKTIPLEEDIHHLNN